jgi:hypothetical protein
MANYYYYILCAMPKLRLGERNRPTVKNFLETRGHLIFKEEWEQINLILLKNDCYNLNSSLNKLEIKPLMGTISLEQLEENIKKGTALPEFIFDFIVAFKAAKIEKADPFDQLLEDYYFYAINHAVPFMKEWFSFERDLHNIIAGLRARKLNVEPGKYIIDHNETAQQILHSFSSPDFELAKKYLWLSEVMHIIEGEDPLVLERKLDEIKWHKLDEMTYHIYFRSEAFLSYFLRLTLLERWLELVPEKTEHILATTLSDLKSKEVEISDE